MISSPTHLPAAVLKTRIISFPTSFLLTRQMFEIYMARKPSGEIKCHYKTKRLAWEIVQILILRKEAKELVRKDI